MAMVMSIVAVMLIALNGIPRDFGFRVCYKIVQR